MKVLVTGASSGIGREMARYFSKLGYELILVARDSNALINLKNELSTPTMVIAMDLSKKENCEKLYETVKTQYGTLDILVNNAGFGLFGNFTQTDLEKEINMIETNILAVHILTKLFLKDMVERDEGHILNVASIAGFMPGPLMATYYSTKNYIVRLTQALQIELKKKHSKVKLSVLCPGPVNTNFNNVANVQFNIKGKSAKQVAKYGIDKMLKNKKIILPGITIKMARVASKIIPDYIVARICYKMQERKRG